MAFKMKRPIIKGSALHKSKSIVADTRTQADPSLVYAGQELGKSYIPGAIDYTLDFPDAPKMEKKKKEGCKKQMSCAEGYKWSWNQCDCVPEDQRDDSDDPQATDPFAPRYTDIRSKKEEEEEVVEEKGGGDDYTTVKSHAGDPYSYRYNNTTGDWEFSKGGSDWDIAKGSGLDAINKRYPNVSKTTKPNITSRSNKISKIASDNNIEINNADDFVAAQESMDYNAGTGDWTMKPKLEFANIPIQEIGSISTGSSTPETIEGVDAPESREVEPTILAHNNPDYDVKESEINIINPEFSGGSISTSSSSQENRLHDGVGYNIHTSDIDGDGNEEILITYNGYEVNYEEIPDDIMQSMTNFINEDKGVSIISNVTEEAKDTTRGESDKIEPPNVQKYTLNKPNPNTRKYKWVGAGNTVGGWKHEGEEKYKQDLQLYNEQQDRLKQESSIKQRDNKIWRNSIKGGPIHKSMRNNGYIPRNER